MVWCQGETDAMNHMEKEEYKQIFTGMLQELCSYGVMKCFMIQIGEYNGNEPISYQDIRLAQEELCIENESVVMVCKEFEQIKLDGGMYDALHYYQWAYNKVGRIAGTTAGQYIMNMY